MKKLIALFAAIISLVGVCAGDGAIPQGASVAGDLSSIMTMSVA